MSVKMELQCDIHAKGCCNERTWPAVNIRGRNADAVAGLRELRDFGKERGWTIVLSGGVICPHCSDRTSTI